jgi:HD domain
MVQMKIIKSVETVYQLLKSLGALPLLIQHLKLVGEAAELLIVQLQKRNIPFDANYVRLGVAVHDAGKILHPIELREKGNQHEASGEILLLAHGVDPKIAQCCRSHARWGQMPCAFEELIVALADNLWKGKRHTALENRVITEIAGLLQQDYWDLFVDLDSAFEQIAAGGDDRLARSQSPT